VTENEGRGLGPWMLGVVRRGEIGMRVTGFYPRVEDRVETPIFAKLCHDTRDAAT
jgi:hypothetical protein